jgi:uncharacterized protein (TIGR02996 family)
MDGILERLQAIRDHMESDGPRLAFADWLEQQGQPARSEWVRASCEFARVRHDDPRWRALFDRRAATFEACRPEWWEWLSNIDPENDRGVFRFVLGQVRTSRGNAPVKRLGKVAWIGQALDEGWLARIDVMWADSGLAGELARWRRALLKVPLLVRPAPQIADEGLRVILDLPMLYGLELVSNVLRLPVVAELGSRPSVRDLTVEFRNVEPERVDLVMDQIVQLAGLRRLHVKGHERIDHGHRPNDADVARLAALPELRSLRVSAAPSVSDDALAAARRQRPDLVVTRLP